jgi:hypothetical protein
LIEEHRNPVIDLRFGGRWNRPAGDLRSATPDNLFAVEGNKFMEHHSSPVTPMVMAELIARLF